jgi:hypothetical protein
MYCKCRSCGRCPCPQQPSCQLLSSTFAKHEIHPDLVLRGSLTSHPWLPFKARKTAKATEVQSQSEMRHMMQMRQNFANVTIPRSQSELQSRSEPPERQSSLILSSGLILVSLRGYFAWWRDGAGFLGLRSTRGSRLYQGKSYDTLNVSRSSKQA